MDSSRVPLSDQTGELVKSRFQAFFNDFDIESYVDDNDDSIELHKITFGSYLFQMHQLAATGKTTVYVNFKHVLQHDLELAEAIELEYYRFEPFFRKAVEEIVAVEHKDYVYDIDKGQRDFFVSFYNLPRTERIRSMRAEKIGRLLAISGTVTRSTEVRPELFFGSFICKKCGTVQRGIEQQFQYTEPQTCRTNGCSGGDYQLLMDECAFVDWQRLRVQENADEIPAGSMPRCIDIICRNEVVETAKAGDKAIFTGCVVVIPDQSGSSRIGDTAVTGKITGRNDNPTGGGVTGLKKLGVKEMTYRMLFIASAIQLADHKTGGPSGIPLQIEHISMQESNDMSSIKPTEAELDTIMTMLKTPHLYNKMVESVCPSIFGHLEVKRGILLMLFGGVHKKTKEGISLRGDINVCIVGDPSVAKSQFLKYVHSFIPRTVYTSGKSTTAAGLTATVVRDNATGEFCVEAGALMLADNGICCIDEFDKMDSGDQVAIHEAMEQQTISITKAGIQATLNARTSILAAANPVFGRYDRSKTLKSNVTISAPIMSRFDLFFVILDECNPAIDERIARHIIDVHRESGRKTVYAETPFSTDQLLLYIRFARTINPEMTDESKKVLVECYRLLRQNDILGKNRTAYRITVRQLESLIRLSEALARLHLDEKVQPVYVREAYRLLQKSLIFVETEDIELEDNEEEMEKIMQTDRGGDYEEGEDDDERGDDHDDNDEGGQRRRRRRDGADQEDHDGRRDEDYRPDGDDYGEQHLSGQKRQHGDADDTIPSAAHASAEPEPDKASAQAAIASTKAKAKQTMSSKDYEDATNMIALFMKAQEEKGDTIGCKWEFVLEWYLSQFQEEFTNIEIYEEKKKLTNQIIRRMIKHDGIIIVINDADKDEAGNKIPNEQKLLRLHPSYEP